MIYICSPPPTNRPNGRLHLGSDQENLADDTPNIVLLDTKSAKYKDDIEDTANNIIKPAKSGFYQIFGQISFNNIVADKKYCAMIYHKYGVTSRTEKVCHTVRSATGETFLQVPVSTQIWIGDYLQYDGFELWYEHKCGVGTVDILSGEFYTYLIAQRIR